MIIFSLPYIARELREDQRIINLGKKVKIKVNYDDEDFELVEENVSVTIEDSTLLIIRAYADDDYNNTYILCEDGKLWEYEQFIEHIQDISGFCPAEWDE